MQSRLYYPILVAVFMLFAAVAFGQDAVTQPRPILLSISPSRGLIGSTATVTFTGRGFDPTPLSVFVSGIGIWVGNITANNATSLNATLNITDFATLGTHYLQVLTADGGFSNPLVFSVDPQPLTVSYSMPQILNATEQANLSMQLTNSKSDSITGHLSVTFLPNAINSADDPSVALMNAQASTRTVDFAFPLDSTNAQFSLAGIALHAGTVAGTIRLSISGTQEDGKDVAISPATFDVTVPSAAPVLTDVRILNRTASGFEVQITGYSTSRDIRKASFQLTQAAGTNLQTSVVQVDLTEPFNAYFQSPNSSAAGGTFIYRQPFVVQGDIDAVKSVTVTLSNAIGDSLPKVAQ
jgi:IPT/TIG domain